MCRAVVHDDLEAGVELALAAERAYQRLVADSPGRRRGEEGRGRRTGARIETGPRRTSQRGRRRRPRAPALRLAVARTRRATLAQEAGAVEST